MTQTIKIYDLLYLFNVFTCYGFIWSFLFLKRMRRGILREIEKTMENKKKESVAIQKESWNQWKEEKKAENRRKREV